MPKKKKVKKTDRRKKQLEKIEKRLKKVDRELALIEKELKMPLESKVVEEELKRRELVGMDIEEKKDRRKFYRNFVFKCMKCLGKFKHNLEFETMKKRVRCTVCGKIHGVGITPSSRYHHIEIPKSLRLLKEKG